jgi:hypothetical protein
MRTDRQTDRQTRALHYAFILCPSCRECIKLAPYLLTYSMVQDIIWKADLSLSLSKKYPAFLWNPKVHFRVYTSPPLDTILSQLNPVRPIDTYLPNLHLKFIIPPMPRSSQWSLAFGPYNQNPVNTSPSPMRATYPVHLILRNISNCPLIKSNNYYKNIRSSTKSPVPPPPTSAEVKNAWSYASTPPILLRGVVRS